MHSITKPACSYSSWNLERSNSSTPEKEGKQKIKQIASSLCSIPVCLRTMLHIGALFATMALGHFCTSRILVGLGTTAAVAAIGGHVVSVAILVSTACLLWECSKLGPYSLP